MSTTVYLVFGEDEYLVSKRGRDLVDSLVSPEDRAFGLEVIDASGDMASSASEVLSLCVAALRTQGFMASRKVVWLRAATCFADNTLGKNQAAKAKADELTSMVKQGLPPSQILVVTALKVDKRCAFYKACKDAGTIEEFAVSDKQYLAERQARERLVQALKRARLRMADDVVNVFLQKVGLDTRHIVNEVEKLAVFVGDRGEITAQDVAAVACTSRGALTWDLADAFGRRDLDGALTVLRQLLFQRESTIGILVGLQSRIRELMVYRDALDKGWVTAGQRNRTAWRQVPPDVQAVFTGWFAKDPRNGHPFRMGVLADQAKGFSRGSLARCFRLTVQTHARLVSTSIPEDIALETLLVQMLAARARS